MMALVILEGTGYLLFPLFIGFALDDMVDGSYAGLINLGILGVVEMILGAGRRFFDTRIYARVYIDMGAKIIDDNPEESKSVISARVHMFEELISFMEKSIPEIITSLVGLIGTVIIIQSFSLFIFTGCIICLVLSIVVFGITSKRTLRFNRNYNDMMEEQVRIIETRNPVRVNKYLKNLMRWSIKLSDLETINFSIIWLGMMGLLVFSIYDTASSAEAVQYGSVLTIVMYVFYFVENAQYMPYYYQHWLRLKEILRRLSNEKLEEVPLTNS